MPTFVLPPPKNKKQQGQQAAYKAYITSHPTMRPYAQAIYKASINNGIDPVYYASLLWKESFAPAAQQGKDPRTIVSPTGAGVGIAQINPSAHPDLTRAQMENPAFAIEWGAKYFAGFYRKYGSYEAAYKGLPGTKAGGYNHGYKGKVFNDLPKGYVATGTQKSATETAQRNVDVAAEKQKLTDPYVGIRNGKLVAVTNPNNAVKVFGAPLTRSQFLTSKSQLNDLFMSYTGKSISDAYVAKILQKGYSRYQLINAWTKRPDFTNSPVWKQQAPGYQSVWQQIYGPDSKPDQEALRYAIVNNLGGEGFASTLRARPDYVGSNEFKGAESSLSAVYTKIYGVPDVKAENLVKQATLHGWNPDQFAAYLRSQPQYTGSEEYQSRALFFATQLGLVTGGQPTLVPGKQGPSPNPNTAGNLPTDPRVPAGSATATSDLVIGPAPGKPTSLAGVVQ